MRRRTLLTATGGLVAGTTAGCLGSLSPGDADGRSADPVYPDDRAVPGDTVTHDLYVENFDAAAHRVELVVRRPEDDALLLDQPYDVPDERAFRVPDLLVEGRAYEFVVALDGGDQRRFDHRVDGCPEDHEGGSRNAGLRIEGSAVDLREDQCDMLVVGTLPSALHDRFFADGTDWN